MIYNSYGIDDMQDFVLMIYTATPRFIGDLRSIRKSGKILIFIMVFYKTFFIVYNLFIDFFIVFR